MPRVRDEPVQRSYVDSIDAGDEHTAAGLYLRAKRDAHDPGLPLGARQEAQHTMRAVRERFPDAHHTAATAADHELGIDNDPDLKRVRNAHRAEHGMTADSAARARRGGGGSSQRAQQRRDRAPARAGGSTGRSRSTSRPPAAGARRRAPGRTPRVVRRIGQEAISTSGAGTFSDLAIKTLGATIAFAVGYAILNNAGRAPRGGAAIELFSKSVTSGIDLFLRPVDPLAPRDPAQRAVRKLARTPTRPIGSTRVVRPGTGPARATL